MFSVCEVKCCVCGQAMDYMKAYGRVACCCGQKCWTEFEWRHTLAIMGKAYYPEPKKEDPCPTSSA